MLEISETSKMPQNTIFPDTPVNRRPIIGVICKHLSSSSPTATQKFFLDQTVLRAIIDHDAIPVSIAIPQHPNSNQDQTGNLTEHEQENLQEQILRCDGIIFPGGQNIEPFENEAAFFVHHKNIPALGFCSGQTVMASIDNINLTNVDPRVHQVPHQDYVHSAQVIPDTLFYRIVGIYELPVNSRHSKAIKKCCHLKVSATDPEGHAEVIEDPGRDFYLATRFHPESLYETDENMDKIFRAFIQACKDYATKTHLRSFSYSPITSIGA